MIGFDHNGLNQLICTNRDNSGATTVIAYVPDGMDGWIPSLWRITEDAKIHNEVGKFALKNLIAQAYLANHSVAVFRDLLSNSTAFSHKD